MAGMVFPEKSKKYSSLKAGQSSFGFYQGLMVIFVFIDKS